MDLTFLGTSSGTPTKQRNVSGLALQTERGRHWYLVDCGEGTQHQLLHTHLSMMTVKAICITHVHGDHCYGLPGLLASAAMGGRTEPLTIIGPAAIRDFIAAVQAFTALHLNYDLEFVAVEELEEWSDDEVCIMPTMLSHRVPSYAYRFVEMNREQSLDTERLLAEGVPRGPLWGRLFNGENLEHDGRQLGSENYLYYRYPPRRVVIAGDNDRPELLAQACADAQVLVHEATYTADVAAKVGPGVQHSYAAQVARFAAEAGLPNLVLTHFSARYQHDPQRSPSIEDIRQEASAQYPGALFLAQDFERYHLDKHGRLALSGSVRR